MFCVIVRALCAGNVRLLCLLSVRWAAIKPTRNLWVEPLSVILTSVLPLVPDVADAEKARCPPPKGHRQTDAADPELFESACSKKAPSPAPGGHTRHRAPHPPWSPTPAHQEATFLSSPGQLWLPPHQGMNVEWRNLVRGQLVIYKWRRPLERIHAPRPPDKFPPTELCEHLRHDAIRSWCLRTACPTVEQICVITLFHGEGRGLCGGGGYKPRVHWFFPPPYSRRGGELTRRCTWCTERCWYWSFTWLLVCVGTFCPSATNALVSNWKYTFWTQARCVLT